MTSLGGTLSVVSVLLTFGFEITEFVRIWYWEPLLPVWFDFVNIFFFRDHWFERISTIMWSIGFVGEIYRVTIGMYCSWGNVSWISCSQFKSLGWIFSSLTAIGTISCSLRWFGKFTKQPCSEVLQISW